MADACWRGYRTDESRTICGTWEPQWRLWLSFCCWDTEDEQYPALSQRAHPASLCGGNCGAAARPRGAFGSSAHLREFRRRGGCLHRVALEPLPACVRGDAIRGIARMGAGDWTRLPRGVRWPEPADAGRLVHRGAHGCRCFLE